MPGIRSLTQGACSGGICNWGLGPLRNPPAVIVNEAASHSEAQGRERRVRGPSGGRSGRGRRLWAPRLPRQSGPKQVTPRHYEPAQDSWGHRHPSAVCDPPSQSVAITGANRESADCSPSKCDECDYPNIGSHSDVKMMSGV